jgi:hypothetical protein
MNRRNLLKLVAVSPFLPAVVRRAAIAEVLKPVDQDKCEHRNTKTVTQEDMDEDMRRRGDIVCSGEMVFYTPGTYCLDCYRRLSD